MQLLKLEINKKTQNRIQVLSAISLVDKITFTDLLKRTNFSRGTLSTHLDYLERQDFINRTPVIKEDEWPPNVFYEITLKGIAELHKFTLLNYIKNSETNIKKFDPESDFYLGLVEVLEERIVAKMLSGIPEKSLKNLLKEQINELNLSAGINAWIIAQSTNAFLYNKGKIPIDEDWLFFQVARMFDNDEKFEPYLEKPEEIGTFSIGIMFDGNEARRLKENPKVLLSEKAFTKYLKWNEKRASNLYKMIHQ